MSYQEEEGYLQLVNDLLASDEPWCQNRTGTPTKRIFGNRLSFSLKDGKLPVMTTKKMNIKNIWTELVWFLQGRTDAKWLAERGVPIWNDNSTREFLDNRGLTHYREGDIGPGYGFQWRHFGAEYRGCDADYTGEGVDQIAEAVSLIKEDPFNRRILVSAWNPAALKEMALPPCHYSVQFFVDSDGKGLRGMVNLRSSDVGLGLPYNIVSYSLFIHMMAAWTGLEARQIILNLGDTHIYQNHVEPLRMQMVRETRVQPEVSLEPWDINDLHNHEPTVIGYDPHPFIKMKMAI